MIVQKKIKFKTKETRVCFEETWKKIRDDEWWICG